MLQCVQQPFTSSRVIKPLEGEKRDRLNRWGTTQRGTTALSFSLSFFAFSDWLLSTVRPLRSTHSSDNASLQSSHDKACVLVTFLVARSSTFCSPRRVHHSTSLLNWRALYYGTLLLLLLNGSFHVVRRKTFHWEHSVLISDHTRILV